MDETPTPPSDIAPATRTCESSPRIHTNERTNGLTEKWDTAVNQVTAVDAHARTDTMVTLGEVLADGFMRTQERWPVVRSGERNEIPGHVRAAIWYRDSGLCDMCPQELSPKDEPLHLDHIVPWSAGGSDTSDNLRLLCEKHNLERSNFIDHQRPKMPVTWWCHRCYANLEHLTWTYLPGGMVQCPIHKHPKRCRVMRHYLAKFEAGTPADWHQRRPLNDFTHSAYCAHCNTPGLTEVLL